MVISHLLLMVINNEQISNNEWLENKKQSIIHSLFKSDISGPKPGGRTSDR